MNRIIGLVHVRNEGPRLAYCVRALLAVCDHVCVVDDASTDDTLDILRDLRSRCPVSFTRLVRTWVGINEAEVRNVLLDMGRRAGGQVFAMLDADESFSFNVCPWARELMQSMKPGETLGGHWIHPWRDQDVFRMDGVWYRNYRTMVFCDAGGAYQQKEKFHFGRIPHGPYVGEPHQLPYNTGFLHFNFVCWDNIVTKRDFYVCQERIYKPNRSKDEIVEEYYPALDEDGLQLGVVEPSWYHPFLDIKDFQQPYPWRNQQINAWIRQYGREYFEGLSINLEKYL